MNERLAKIHAVFCRENCKHRQEKNCREVNKRATLSNCPVGEWWDLNDWLNHVEIVLGKIQRQYAKAQASHKEGPGGILRGQ